MFNPMSPPPGPPGFAPPLFAHFVPAPGSPHGALLALPHRPTQPNKQHDEQHQRAEGATDSAENELLKKILLSVSRISHQVKHNEKALRDITGRQSAIEDRLSLMEQRVLRTDTRVLEMLEQNKQIHDNVKKSLFEVGCVADEFQALKGAIPDDGTIQSLEKAIEDESRSTRDALGGQMRALDEEVKDIKTLIQQNAREEEQIVVETAPAPEQVNEEPALAIAETVADARADAEPTSMEA
ncbi:MAG: hypothetical protein M1833_002500 [Piccolia ochrophora]|nr:MAG: hypothetical protein M1833_002500 [Piccolia ochrophora]